MGNTSEKRIPPIVVKTILGLLTASLLLLSANNVLNKKSTSYAVASQPVRRQLQEERANPAIVTLVDNDSDSLSDLCLMLKSLLFLKGGYGGSFIRGGPAGIYTSSPVLIFNEGDLNEEQMQNLRTCTSRPLSFPVVDINTFPEEFKQGREWEAYSKWTTFRPMKGRRDWSYAQMMRFWTSKVFKHPAVQEYDLIMKIDSDACFMRQRYVNLNPFYQEAPALESKYVYQTNYDGAVTGNPQFVENLYETARKYMKDNDITPSNPLLWQVIKNVWEDSGNMPVFSTHFEICRLSFFKSEPVQKWLDHLIDGRPFGVYRYRWSDSITRVVTMAMFGTVDNLLLSKTIGYLHGRGRCAKNFIDDAHDRYKTEERW